MWDFFEPQDRQWYRWALAGAEAYVRKNGDEWRIAFQSIPYERIQAASVGPEAVAAPDLPSVAFVVGRGRKLALRPRLSEMPYLIVARDDVRILPGAEARFQVALPPLVRFELEDGQILGEAMPFILSNTWFGDKSGGTLCLSMPTALDPRCRGEVEDTADSAPSAACGGADAFQGDLERNRALIHCEIVVRNGSKAVVDLKRLAIYTDLLSLYLHEDMIHSDTVLVDSLADGGLRMGIDEGVHRGQVKLEDGNKGGLSELLIRRGVNFLKTVTGM